MDKPNVSSATNLSHPSKNITFAVIGRLSIKNKICSNVYSLEKGSSHKALRQFAEHNHIIPQADAWCWFGDKGKLPGLPSGCVSIKTIHWWRVRQGVHHDCCWLYLFEITISEFQSFFSHYLSSHRVDVKKCTWLAERQLLFITCGIFACSRWKYRCERHRSASCFHARRYCWLQSIWAISSARSNAWYYHKTRHIRHILYSLLLTSQIVAYVTQIYSGFLI